VELKPFLLDIWLDTHEHFRLGFAAMTDTFPAALDRLGTFVNSWSTANRPIV
jgi:hypothetical protein